LGQLFDELKRRNVFRVAVAYLVAAWLVLQVADLVLENIGAPDWVMKVLILLFALGFPLVLIFSWAYELTPEGLKREKDVDRGQSVTRQTGRKLNQITIGLLITVIVIVIADRTMLPHGELPEEVVATTEVTDKSIAVLAFEDLSADGDQEYFADGLSEELLNVLAQVPDLQVAGRTSSFAFKGQNKDLREIGDILNVAHILEGSVRKAGNRIRVTAQLINADNGFHLFSETYDRDLDDIFAVQDELAAKISTALQSELIGTETIVEASPTEVAAFDLYLEARQLIHSRDREPMAQAVELLDEALALDPDYVPALTQKSLGVYLLSDSEGAYGDIPKKEALAVARPLVDRALELDERYAEAWAVSGLIMGEQGASLDDQIAALRRAVALNPSLENAKTWLSSALTASRQDEEARVLLEGIVERDPLFGPAFNNLTQLYVRTREYDKAVALIDRVQRITGETLDVMQSRALISFSRGDLADAVRLYEPVIEDNPYATVAQNLYTYALLSLGDYDSLSAIPSPFAQISAAIAAGDRETGEALLIQIVESAGLDDTLGLASFFYTFFEDHETLLALVDTHFDGADDVLERRPQTASIDLGYMPNLAWAYQQAGRQADFRKVVDAMAIWLEANNAENEIFVPILTSAIDYCAVTGDVDCMLRYARKVDGFNATWVEPFTGPLYEPYSANDDFQQIAARIQGRADNERAKLGMAPYQPIAITQ
jgi:TolB-like protein/Tfp pilus assembly protein PilF